MINFKNINLIENQGNHLLVNKRYAIYFDDGCVYDTLKAADIPAYIFDLRDKLLKEAIYG